MYLPSTRVSMCLKWVNLLYCPFFLGYKFLCWYTFHLYMIIILRITILRHSSNTMHLLNKLRNCTLTRHCKLLKETGNMAFINWPFFKLWPQSNKILSWFDAFLVSISKILSEWWGSPRHKPNTRTESYTSRDECKTTASTTPGTSQQ